MTVDRPLYLSAADAARILNVKLSSLYAYVSRGKIRSAKVDGSRERLYWREDIEKIKKNNRSVASDNVAHSDLIDRKTLQSETSIAFIGPDGPYYRGVSAIELAESADIEDVACLLWQGDRESTFPQSLARVPPGLLPAQQALSSSLGVIEQAVALLMLIDSVNPRSHDLSEHGYRRTGADVLRWFAAILVGAESSSALPLHSFVANCLGRPELADVIRRLMILGAAHELDPSTYAVRAAANAGVTPYYAVIAGIVAYRGHRLPMSRAEPLAVFLEQITNSDDPAQVVARRFRSGDRFVGFGSPMYGNVDPRAEALMPHLAALLDGDRGFEAFRIACAEVEELTGRRAGLTVVAAYIGRLLGLEGAQQISMLLLGRSAGWIANAMEQYFNSELVRPRGTYIGALPSAPRA